MTTASSPSKKGKCMPKMAIVTGCSRGIGAAVTDMLLAEGWKVIGVSRTVPDMCRRGFSFIGDDLSTDGRVAGVLQYHVLAVDALIHCAGIRGPYGSFLETDPEAWERTIATNLLGTARIVRAALPSLHRSDDGRILLFAGGGAFDPSPGFSAYACSKAGVVSLTETLSAELRGTGVTVNAISPGFIATGIHAGTPDEGRDDGGEALPNAVACVQHLLSADTRGLTGKTISAQWDDFRSVDQVNVEALNASPMGTRSRHKIQCVQNLVRPQRLIAV